MPSSVFFSIIGAGRTDPSVAIHSSSTQYSSGSQPHKGMLVSSEHEEAIVRKASAADVMNMNFIDLKNLERKKTAESMGFCREKISYKISPWGGLPDCEGPANRDVYLRLRL